MTVNSSQGAAPAPKKGLGPLAWIGIGCGIVLVVGAVILVAGGIFVKHKVESFAKNPAMTAAKAVVAMDPDLELVSVDEATQVLTVKNRKTGEIVTVNMDDAKQGKFKFSGKDGEVNIDATQKDGSLVKVTDKEGNESTLNIGAGAPKNLPSWIPMYPGAEAQGNYAANTNEGSSGAFTLKSSDSIEKVMAFYEEQLKSAGMKVSKFTTSGEGNVGGSVNGETEDGKHTLTIAMSTSEGGHTEAVVTYNDKK